MSCASSFPWASHRRGARLALVVSVFVAACGGAGFTGTVYNPPADSGAPGADSAIDVQPGPGMEASVGPDTTTPADTAVVDTVVDSVVTPGPDATPACSFAAQCDDGLGCTQDDCPAGTCVHAPVDSRCGANARCDARLGCVTVPTCTSNGQCADTNPCTANERCDMVTGRCRYDTTDADRDGYPPIACGGTDCDDARASVRPGGSELCNSLDDDCNGRVDDVPASRLASDAFNCGACGNRCSGSTPNCSAGRCAGSSGPSCGSACSAHTDCQSWCAAPSTGYVWCCTATSSGVCYQSAGTSCGGSSVDGGTLDDANGPDVDLSG